MSKAKRFNHKATYVMEPCVVLSICLSVDLRVRIYTDVLSIYVYATVLRSATPIKGRKDAKNPTLCTYYHFCSFILCVRFHDGDVTDTAPII